MLRCLLPRTRKSVVVVPKCFLSRPGPREPPRSVGNGGPGPPQMSSDRHRESLDFEIGVGDRLGTLKVSKSERLFSIYNVSHGATTQNMLRCPPPSDPKLVYFWNNLDPQMDDSWVRGGTVFLFDFPDHDPEVSAGMSAIASNGYGRGLRTPPQCS